MFSLQLINKISELKKKENKIFNEHMVYDYEALSSFVQLRTSMTEELSVSIWCKRLWKIS